MKKLKIFLLLLPIILSILFMTIVLAITGPHYCREVPYDPNCYCKEGERKVSVPYFVPRWTCEKLENLLLDPDSPTFEQDAINFVKVYLFRYCGDTCGSIECGDWSYCIQGNPPEGKDECIDVAYGYTEFPGRFALIECRVVTERDEQGRPLSGYTKWAMNFYVESETGVPKTMDVWKYNNFCMSPDGKKKCTLPEVCSFYNNPDWCVPNLQLEIA
ncbi:MAG: hypothetical protein ACTSWZ_07820 [Candidatus Heimdallarchaeaceae archaeon]